MVVRFENVGMRYGMGEEVLKDISFHLPEGSFHFLSGPSGAGKSSLLKLIYLAHRPSRGLITLFGQDIILTRHRELPALRRKIGVVFQDFRLLDHLSAFDNVALPLRIIREKESVIRSHVTELLAWVGLEGRMNARPPTLSGGEKQRVAIARAVIARPSLLLADEPTGNVDPGMGERIVHLLLELNRVGTTTLVATHDNRLMDSVPDARRLILDRGEMTITQPLTAGSEGEMPAWMAGRSDTGEPDTTDRPETKKYGE